ncbi:MAG: hypothetical protein HRU15_15360, partial [Planctomycetes bacterium]|nr:hypothetical protein [Planctomycetota bacterium]
MLDLRRKKGPPSVDPQRRGFSTKDKIMLISVFACLLIVITAIIEIDKQVNRAKSAEGESPKMKQISEMTVPDLDQAKRLPSVADSEVWSNNSQWLIDNPQELSNHLNGFTAKCFSWWKEQRAHDEKNFPEPQFYPVADIAGGSLEFGTTILTSGLLVKTSEAIVEGEAPWQWMLIELPHLQFVLLIVPGDEQDYVIGEEINILGRYLSTCLLPGGKSGERIVVIGARHVSPKTKTIEIENYGMDKLIKNINTTTADDEKELWKEINDENPILELKPYYYMLAKVLMKDSFDDHIYDQAQNANAMSMDLHDRPSDYRDQIFTVEGKVLESFIDEGVASEQPYGISKVTRIIMWLHVYGDYKERDITGNISHTQKLVAHSYELALVGAHKAPKKGQRIRARGRFLKVHGMPMEPSVNREAVFGQAHSK